MATSYNSRGADLVNRYVCCECGYSEEWIDKEDIATLKKKYISSPDSRKESAIIKKSLGEVLKNHRTKNKMTQEF